MSRLIDADALIDGYKHMGYDPSEHPEESYMEGWCKGFNSAVDHCVHHAIHAPTIEPEQKWISVKEKLPEEDKNVLVTVHFLGLEKYKNGWNDHIKPSYYVDIASHIDGEWSSASDEYKVARNRHIVIAWQELPEPYREEGEE